MARGERKIFFEDSTIFRIQHFLCFCGLSWLKKEVFEGEEDGGRCSFFCEWRQSPYEDV